MLEVFHLFNAAAKYRSVTGNADELHGRNCDSYSNGYNQHTHQAAAKFAEH